MNKIVALISSALGGGVVTAWILAKKNDQETKTIGDSEKDLRERETEDITEKINDLVHRRAFLCREKVPAYYNGRDLVAWNDTWLSDNYGIWKEHLVDDLERGDVFLNLKKHYFDQDSYINALFEMCRDNGIVGIKFSLAKLLEGKIGEYVEYDIKFDSITDLMKMKSIDFRDYWYGDSITVTRKCKKRDK